VDAAGNGGMGGTITLKASGNTLTTNGLINADGAPGGGQFGKGGNGGTGAERGGDGGSVRQSGNGGSGGTVTITATTFNRTNDPTAFGKLEGVQNGQFGLGGSVGGANGKVDPKGMPGTNGTITISRFKNGHFMTQPQDFQRGIETTSEDRSQGSENGEQ
jgi:hypothetical protein